MSSLFDYVEGDTQTHRLHPLTKLVLAFCLCAAIFLSRSHLYILMIAAVNLCFAASAGRAVLARVLRVFRSLLKFAAVLFVIQVLVIRDGTALLRLPFDIRVTDTGILFSLLFSMRLVFVAAPLAFMLSVTRISDISNVLVRNLHIPYKYTFAITTAIRFIPLFASEMAGIMEAQTSRGVEFDTKNFYKKIRLLLPLCVPLLVSSVRRIEGGAISAELRGFNLRTRHSGWRRYSFAPADICVFICCAALVTFAVLK